MVTRSKEPISTKAPPTDFEEGTHRFGLLIMRMTILLVLFVLLVNAFFHRPWLESFLFAVALAVGLLNNLLYDVSNYPSRWTGWMMIT